MNIYFYFIVRETEAQRMLE